VKHHLPELYINKFIFNKMQNELHDKTKIA
jgi:hypothetical protein